MSASFALPGAGELICWSRVLDDEEALCIANGNGAENRGGDVVIDASLNGVATPGNNWPGGQPFLQVVANSAQAAAGAGYAGAHPVGQRLPVKWNGATAYVEIRDLPPTEVLVLINRP